MTAGPTRMPRSTLEQVRLPLALALLLVAILVVVVSGNDDDELATGPSPSVVVGEPGGGVIEATPGPPSPAGTSPTATAPATSQPTEAATPEPTPAPTPQPDGFTAEIHACRSLSGSTCVDELTDLGEVEVFTALLLFTDSNTGDTMNAVLRGPSGPIEGGAYTLPSGGDGYYYATFSTGGLESGEYTLIGMRNGDEVASTQVRR